ncbi:MAG TPA: arsenosugar biosynthesis radical SAM (seleno)protein ArsS [Syntrophomonadaceae bacterium]|nr:arsenosugar biosynthesis radical SAM (seleno)protein ArsS [Syntrophomonadaceae bacterium]
MNSTAEQLQCLGDIGIIPFAEKIKETDFYPLISNDTIKTMQVNVGKVCNLTCKHCHVQAGPHRTESMSRATMGQCLEVVANNKIPTLDITGGAPELNSNLSWMISEARQIGCHVIVRTNLTVFESEHCFCKPEFYAEHKVELIASLPYYTEKDTDRQRGPGVFRDSIKGLKILNELGYGQKDGLLIINLVYNPGGAFLPPAQPSIEADYHRELTNKYGVCFNNVYTITNVPVGRFLQFLTNSGNLKGYLSRLAGSFNSSTVGKVMCRDQISVDWDGQLYDCDFNQALGLKCSPGHISEFSLDAFKERKIALGNHCYACTAGQGSSCGGATI